MPDKITLWNSSTAFFYFQAHMMLRITGRTFLIGSCRIFSAAVLAVFMLMASSCSDDAPIPKPRLLGTDSDGDGVRDDVAEEIAMNALLNGEQKKAHMQWAAAFQTMFAADLGNEDEVRNAIYEIDEAANCFFHVYLSLFGSSADAQTAIRTDMRTLSAKINNTRERRTFFKQFNKKKEITPARKPDFGDADTCHFHMGGNAGGSAAEASEVEKLRKFGDEGSSSAGKSDAGSDGKAPAGK